MRVSSSVRSWSSLWRVRPRRLRRLSRRPLVTRRSPPSATQPLGIALTSTYLIARDSFSLLRLLPCQLSVDIHAIDDFELTVSHIQCFVEFLGIVCCVLTESVLLFFSDRYVFKIVVLSLFCHTELDILRALISLSQSVTLTDENKF